MPHVELPQAEFKIVMLGETFTGKTSLVLRFAEGYYRDSARNPTVGAFFITKKMTVSGKSAKIQIWDTAGQEQFKRLAPMYYKNAEAAIICYDVTSPQSFATLEYWMNELKQNIPTGKIVLAMCATKCDLTTNPDTSHAEALAESMGALFMTTSAKNNSNVNALFKRVSELVLHNQQQQQSMLMDDGTFPLSTIDGGVGGGVDDGHDTSFSSTNTTGSKSNNPHHQPHTMTGGVYGSSNGTITTGGGSGGMPAMSSMVLNGMGDCQQQQVQHQSKYDPSGVGGSRVMMMSSLSTTSQALSSIQEREGPSGVRTPLRDGRRQTPPEGSSSGGGGGGGGGDDNTTNSSTDGGDTAPGVVVVDPTESQDSKDAMNMPRCGDAMLLCGNDAPDNGVGCMIQ